MIDSVEIKNFRGFKELSLKPFGRINIIVGDNGSGKTSLCESLFLTGGMGPEIFLRTKIWRGTGEQVQFTLDREGYESVWREIFHDLDQNVPVTMEFTDSESGTRSLRVYYGKGTYDLILPIDRKTSSTSLEASSVKPITFEWRTPDGSVQPLQVELTPDGIKLPQMSGTYPMIFLSTTTIFNPADNARRFSVLSRKNQHKEVVAIVKSIFDYVEDISVEVSGGSTGLFAQVRGLEERLPIGSLSGGLTKFIAIIIAIAAQPRGVVIVDEIENGFYYKKFPMVWKAVVELCQSTETQLFVSTHSMEWLRAAQEMVSQKPSLFTLLRTERLREYCDVKMFNGKELSAGLAQQLEFR